MKHNKLLRATYFFLAFLTVAVSVSCSKDKDKEPASNDGIEGTWELVSYTYDGNLYGFDEPVLVTIEGADINNVRVTFNSDGTVTGNGTSFNLIITSKDNPDEPFGFPTTMFEEEGLWEIEGNTLYITEFLTEERTSVPIATLNATTLRLSGNVAVNHENGDEATVDVRFTRSN